MQNLPGADNPTESRNSGVDFDSAFLLEIWCCFSVDIAACTCTHGTEAILILVMCLLYQSGI